MINSNKLLRVLVMRDSLTEFLIRVLLFEHWGIRLAYLEYLETLIFNERTFEAEMTSSSAFDEEAAKRDIQAFHSPVSQQLYADVTKRRRVWQLRRNGT